MRKRVVFITGAAGEVGQALIKELAAEGSSRLLTMDLQPLPAETRGLVARHVESDLLNRNELARIISEYELDAIYHLAALLSTRSEFSPEMAHRVNVDGTLSLLQLAAEQSQWRKQPVQFIFPSSIAIYGMPDLESKKIFQRVREFEWNQPRTMYGCNKLYCEQLGRYYARNYKQLAPETLSGKVDFRSIRFPGLISAFTVPSGGTSDFAPEMIHAAASGKPYACFVRPDARIPFMAMPDAVDAFLQLAAAPREKLTRTVYNIGAFAPSAGEVQEIVERAFPGAGITTAVDAKRQGIVDSWPADVDDSAARADWGLAPRYDLDRAFQEYLIPNIRNAYQG